MIDPPLTDAPRSRRPIWLAVGVVGAALLVVVLVWFQPAQTSAPQIAAASEFISLDHGTSGTALVVALPDGGVTLRFEDLDTSNGPDLYVVLTPHAADSGNYDGRLQLGRLKGNRGDQNYDIPPGTDLTAFRSVVIWCERFSSPFGAAPVEVM